MDTFNLLLQGFGTALSLTNLLWALFGCALGTAVGVLPGIGPATTVAMLPATKEPIAAVASAAPARPLLAILLPSMAVTMLAVSPGVLSRIDVVLPPYIAP